MRTLGFMMLLVVVSFSTTIIEAADYYVSANRGKGRKGTKVKPAKSIGNILKKILPGDTIHVAQGTYIGKSDSGNVLINVPVKLIGGYDDTFTKRDPWGAHKTILSGNNKSDNYANAIRLRINLDKFNRDKKMEFHRAKKIVKYDVLVDGFIVDNAGRNRYKSKSGNKIVRLANPKTGENPTPDKAGISVSAPIHGSVTVVNCIVLNCAPTGGALAVWGSIETTGVIRNNLVINNTGVGIWAHTAYHASDAKKISKFTITNNTVLFTEKYDAFGGINGHAFQLDGVTHIVAKNNVFAYSDQVGVNNPSKSKIKHLTLADNLVYGNGKADLIEFNTKMPVDTWEDDSDELSDDSEGNEGKPVKAALSEDWLGRYMARNVIDRKAAEADVKAEKSRINEWRSVFGLPLKAKDLKLDSDVWLPRMSLEDALKAGTAPYLGKYGCKKPAL